MFIEAFLLKIIMEIQITEHQLKLILQAASALGANAVLVHTGKIKPYLTKAESFRLYGRKNIEQWIEEGLITVRKDGDQSASLRIDRVEVEAVVKSMEILQHLFLLPAPDLNGGSAKQIHQKFRQKYHG